MKKITEKIKEDEIINLIKKYSQNANIYLVGGAVRDFYSGDKNFDKDLIVDKINPKKFAKNLAEKIDATFISLDEENKIYRLISQDKLNCIDIAGILGENLEDDLKRRDLTINSIAVNLKTYKIIDFNNGIKDLKEKKIRHISEQNFIDDPLRLLRIYRFQSLLGFEIDKKLSEIVKTHAPKIKSSSVERVNYEFLKLFSGKFSDPALKNMNKTGLLAEILPIMQEVKKVPSNLHHHLDLFNHSIEVVKQIQLIYEKSSKEIKEHLEKIDFGGETRLTHLKFAGFLHDIGKPQTWTIEKTTQRHRFIKHDDIGSKMSIELLKKLKFSKKQIDYISKLIKNHIYPSHVVSAPEVNDKTYMRFIRKMGNDVIDIIILAMSDRLSARGVAITDEIVKNNLDNLQALLNFYIEVKDTIKPLPKLLSGNEIMEMLNIKPSRELGEIINALKEAQLSGEILTKKEAVKFVKNFSKAYK